VHLLQDLWRELIWPLTRLLGFIGIGLLAANLLEALGWTRHMALLARPLVRFGHLSELTGAAFSTAFVSGVSANTMLAEGYDKGDITRRELVLANLFNSLPAYFLHLPTTLVITVPLIREAALAYVGLTAAGALLRTGSIVVLGHFLLPRPIHRPAAPHREARPDLSVVWARTKKRCQRRMRKIVRYTIPIYVLFYLIQRSGGFALLETWLGSGLAGLSFLSPEAMSIVALHVSAEFTAGIAAAGALLQNGSLPVRDVVLALLAGNILSSPIRAVRHQYPYYAGIFRPRLAGLLICLSQGFRTASILLVTLAFAWLTR